MVTIKTSDHNKMKRYKPSDYPTGLLRVGKVEKKVEPIDGNDKK